MNDKAKPTARQRLLEELRKYALITLYLWVCFGVILLNKAAVLSEQGIDYLPLGIALVKALVLGKFILIGDAMSVGRRAERHPLLRRIAWKSVAFLILLIVFKILEEIIVGWFHDEPVRQAVSEFMARSWIENLAPVFLMLLILIPIIAATEIYRALGPEGFRASLLDRDD